MELVKFTVNMDVGSQHASVEVHCAVNHKNLKDGDELVLYKEAVEKKEKDTVILADLESKSKRRKIP